MRGNFFSNRRKEAVGFGQLDAARRCGELRRVDPKGTLKVKQEIHFHYYEGGRGGAVAKFLPCAALPRRQQSRATTPGGTDFHDARDDQEIYSPARQFLILDDNQRASSYPLQ